ncbi:hypothetical protein C5142_03595 [Rhodococcus sp. BGS-1C]|jgi:hypothetical protein
MTAVAVGVFGVIVVWVACDDGAVVVGEACGGGGGCRRPWRVRWRVG